MFLPLSADGPSRRFPVATFLLAALNLTIFGVEIALPDAGVQLLYAAGAIPYEVVHCTDLVSSELHPPALVPPPLTILTAMFLHGGVEHLAGNLWFLWIFGRRVEANLGAARFLLFYLGVGILAAIVQVALTPASRVPMVGASGAIAGVLGAYLCLCPAGKVQVLVFLIVIVETAVVPAFAVLGVWFMWQILADKGDGSVATWAHLGGFLIGFASCTLLRVRAAGRNRPAAAPSHIPWIALPAAGTSSSPR